MLESLSKQFDNTRAEIVTNFRTRIAKGQRSKLSKLELEELIAIFITTLQLLSDASSIQQLCQDEIALLEEGYPPASVAKNYLPKYRRAIALAVEEQRIILNKNNSHTYTYFKDGAEHLTTEHWALTYLKYDRTSYEQFAKSTISNNNSKQDSLQPVNLALYLENVNSLLRSSQPSELAIAIAAVTGRRFSEVISRGVFRTSDHPYQLYFQGQLKKRGLVDDEYLIYTLVPAVRILDAAERLRTHRDIAGLCCKNSRLICSIMQSSIVTKLDEFKATV
jgi:hypothetical protein